MGASSTRGTQAVGRAASSRPHRTAAPDSARARLTEAALDHLLAEGRPEASLRALAAGLGVSHSLLLYHFGSTTGLLAAVHTAGEARQRVVLQDLTRHDPAVGSVIREMWRHLSDVRLWPLYRLGFALRARQDVTTDDDEQRSAWLSELRPLVAALGVAPEHVDDEATLWLASCRGLLWELVTGADPAAVDAAAQRLFARYPDH